MSTLIVVQARMTSTRLPGKVLLPIAGRPMLSYQMERLRRVKGCDVIAVATTTNTTDDPIVEFCVTEKLACNRGSEEDVLSRYYETARRFDGTTVVRVTSDCPLLDPAVVDRVISEFFDSSECDFASNMIRPTFPYGMAVEVMTFKALREAHAEARSQTEREHVTPFIYWHPERYRIRSITIDPDLSGHRWTVDTPDDFVLVRRILEALYPINPDFHIDDVLSLLQLNPDWEAINRHVTQKLVIQSGEVS